MGRVKNTLGNDPLERTVAAVPPAEQKYYTELSLQAHRK